MSDLAKIVNRSWILAGDWEGTYIDEEDVASELKFLLSYPQ